MVFDGRPKISRKIKVATFHKGAEYVQVQVKYAIVAGVVVGYGRVRRVMVGGGRVW
jgi:hypothetical protein